MTVSNANISQFWAKTTVAGRSSIGASYKSVLHHLLDVGAVAQTYLTEAVRRAQREATRHGLTAAAYVRLGGFAAALHDLGKLSRAFQILVPELWPTAALGSFPTQGCRPIRHWEATALLLRAPVVKEALAPAFKGGVMSDDLIAAIAGHHGVPPVSPQRQQREGDAETHEGIGRHAPKLAAKLVSELIPLFEIDSPLDLADVDEKPLGFALNGLITLADWLGSGADFPFEDPEMPGSVYWPLAQERARQALRRAGLLPVPPAANPTLAAISPRAGGGPRPMQSLAGELELSNGPQLVLIEDGTGSGKTEAALLLAARMMATGLGEGVYLALPTMATANAMHARLKLAISGLFDEEGERQASLVLAHGRSRLANALSQLGSQPGEQAEGAVADRLSRWIADSRKKTFFADVGVGTIDQAFLSILPKKHLTLRQYALAGRILIIDEAHAYDAYMGEELKTLLEMQARLGGSAIVLSATLPQQKRRDFVMAFAKGAGLKDGRGDWRKLADSLSSAAYPLLTHYGAGRLREIAPQPLSALTREVKVVQLPDRAAAVFSALAAASRGAAVAVICNAVDEAIATFEQLRAGLPEGHAHLFHARFAMGDRMRIECAAMARFGAESTPVQRAGQVLVATQVIEQSLDLDFDLIVTDLAPVDLVIQRAGRLWRHRRDGRPLPVPVIQFVSPVFPACAGMNRRKGASKAVRGRVPRMRGDEPIGESGLGGNSIVFPACAGMNRDAFATAYSRFIVTRPGGGPCACGQGL